MRVPLDYRHDSLHSEGRVRIGLTIRLAVNAGLRVGVAVGSLAGIDTAVVADCDFLDTSGAVDGGLGKSEIDDDVDDRADNWTDDTDEVEADDEVSWQHRTVSSDCIADRIGSSYKDYGTLGAKGDGKVAEAAEWLTSVRAEAVDILV